MKAVKFYLKFIVISTLIMLLASNQAFSTVIFNQLLQREVNGLMMQEQVADIEQKAFIARNMGLIIILSFLWILVPLSKRQ